MSGEELQDASLRDAAGLDRLIHEPARMVIVTILSTVENADFLFLLKNSGLTKGNLSAHLTRLETAGYIMIEKTYRGKVPQTLVSLTDPGRSAFEIYRKQLTAFINHLSEK
jgi:DNA-binding MarR family transcriptional regulator